MICIWSGWCHCHPIISCFSKIQNGLPFWCRLTQVVLEKKAIKCVCMCVCIFYRALCMLLWWYCKDCIQKQAIWMVHYLVHGCCSLSCVMTFCGVILGKYVKFSTRWWNKNVILLSVKHFLPCLLLHGCVYQSLPLRLQVIHDFRCYTPWNQHIPWKMLTSIKLNWICDFPLISVHLVPFVKFFWTCQHVSMQSLLFLSCLTSVHSKLVIGDMSS